MFDKIPSLKDFILYVIPGVLICYFGLEIFNHLDLGNLTTEEISKDNVVSFIGIVFSFLVGFIFSQIQIIIFNFFFKRRFEKMRTIEESQKANQDLKNELILRIKKEFGLTTNDFEKDHLLIFTCLNFVKIKTNSESQAYIDRYNNLSSFAMTLPLPISMGIYYFLLKTNYPLLQMTIFLIISILVIIIVVRKIVLNFRDDYYKNIFRQFLVLSK